MFPCSNPANPHMRKEAARLQTFRARSHRRPAHRIAATPGQMSQAGLYYRRFLRKVCPILLYINKIYH